MYTRGDTAVKEGSGAGLGGAGVGPLSPRKALEIHDTQTVQTRINKSLPGWQGEDHRRE